MDVGLAMRDTWAIVFRQLQIAGAVAAGPCGCAMGCADPECWKTRMPVARIQSVAIGCWMEQTRSHLTHARQGLIISAALSQLAVHKCACVGARSPACVALKKLCNH